MNFIINIVQKIKKQYKTNDPFLLCEAMDVNLNIINLPSSIKGAYTKYFDIPFIFINEKLCEPEKRAVCAHELGHMILHSDSNTLFIQEKTLISTQKLERQADVFAAFLLIDDVQNFDENVSVEDLAFAFDVPKKYIEIKYSYMKP